jgi:hypothetical protein
MASRPRLDALRIAVAAATVLATVVPLVHCSATAAPAPKAPPCDQKCQDGVAIKAIRETMKLAFNLTLQGKPVGAHDETRPCPFGGSVRVYGTATSNAIQGATEVDLTYELDGCGYLFRDDDPDDNYTAKLSATITQRGILAVQPTATSAVIMGSAAVRYEGTVYDPPIDYNVDCPLELAQNGNTITGRICGRDARADL